jgi:ribonuclease III
MTQTHELNALMRKLDYTFKDESLLHEALTHRSVASLNNERLEFLGDGALNFVIAAHLFEQYPHVQEGDLSRLRASLVNRDSLAEVARRLTLGEYIRLGPGEMKSGGFRRASILADAVESILGAVYRDGGFDQCRRLILDLFAERFEQKPDLQGLKDAKTQLQELLQSQRIALPEYNVTNISGKSHEQQFTVECRIDYLECTTLGTGRSRRKAEQIAAELAIEQVSKMLETNA